MLPQLDEAVAHRGRRQEAPGRPERSVLADHHAEVPGVVAQLSRAPLDEAEHRLEAEEEVARKASPELGIRCATSERRWREQQAREEEVREIAERKSIDWLQRQEAQRLKQARAAEEAKRREEPRAGEEVQHRGGEGEGGGVSSRLSLLIYETVANIFKLPAVRCTVSVR